MIRVSVVIPFYNTPAAFLREAIQSVIAQTYRYWELLLVDDGSTGQAREVARNYAATNEARIRYLDHPGHENRGHSASRNLGIAHARGEFIALLDSDDVWLPQKLDEQVSLMDAHPEVGMLYGSTIYWHSWSESEPDGRRDYVPDVGWTAPTVVPPPRLLPLYLQGRVAVPCTCSLLARRETVQEVSGFVESARGLYEDQLFYAKMVLHAPVLVVPMCWDLYRQHSDSLCNRASGEEQRRSRAEFLRWVESYVTKRGFEDPSLRDALRRERWKNRHPALARALRTAGRLRRRVGAPYRPSQDVPCP